MCTARYSMAQHSWVSEGSTAGKAQEPEPSLKLGPWNSSLSSQGVQDSMVEQQMWWAHVAFTTTRRVQHDSTLVCFMLLVAAGVELPCLLSFVAAVCPLARTSPIAAHRHWHWHTADTRLPLSV